MAWLFVPESEGWSLESAFRLDTPIAPSVMWRGKPMPPRSWQRAWEKHSWLRLLSGTTLPPSMADLGVDAWISSLRATPASPSATPAIEAAPTTPGTSGPTSSASGGSVEQLSCFARTSPAILRSDSTQSAATFRAWGRGLRRAYSARLKSGRRTAASDCSSWQTASVVDSVGRDYTYPSGDHSKPFDTLVGQAKKHWPTATTLDTMDAARKGIVGNHNLSLPVAASRHGRQALRPTGAECQKNSGRLWGTAQASDHVCAARTAKDSRQACLGRDLSRLGSDPKRLNPRFVEWLMGWPLGWTDFAPVATEWSRWSQRMRCELSRLS